MTAAEKKIIVDFADGKKELREEAIEIYRRDVMATGASRGTPEKEFMSEVDNSCPDLFLRALNRKALLLAHGRK